MKLGSHFLIGIAVGTAILFQFEPYAFGAGTFPLAISANATNYQLAAITATPERLAWLMGTRPDAITNLVDLETLPLLNHGFKLNYSGAAAFYRAVLLDSNAITVPLAVGTDHAVAVLPNGLLESWGDNSLGQFGNSLPITPVTGTTGCWIIVSGYTNTSQGPLPQSSETNWMSVAAGPDFTLALKSNGTLWGWGNNAYGALAMATNSGGPAWSAVPVAIGNGSLWRSVFTYGYSCFAIRTDGTLWAWGYNKSSALGVGPGFSSADIVWSPNQVGTANNWLSVYSLPNSHSVGIQTDGTLWAWGQTILPTSARAALADTNFVLPIVTSPALVDIPGPWIGASAENAASEFTFLRGDGTLWEVTTNVLNIYSWQAYFNFWQNQYDDPGSFYHQLIGLGFTPDQAYSYVFSTLFYPTYGYLSTYNPSNYPAFLASVSDANFLRQDQLQNKFAMLGRNVALSHDGTVWTIGDDPNRSPSSPRDGPWQRLNSDTDWRFVAGSVAKAAIKADGSVWVWDEGGQLNLNSTAEAAPVEIPGKTWLDAKVSRAHVVALDTLSNLWVWGANGLGQLGVGDYEPRLVPTPLPMAGPWLNLAANDSMTAAVRQGGTLWAWGNFDNTGTNVSHPVQLSPDRLWKSVYSASDGNVTNFYAVALDGTLWQFGSPTLEQVPGSNWVSVCPTIYNILAIQTDGTLWGWGAYLGFGLPTSFQSTPVELSAAHWQIASAGVDPSSVISDYDVGSNAAGADQQGINGYAVGLNGTLWSWGTRDAMCELGLLANQTWANTNCWTCYGAPCGDPSPEVQPYGTNVVVTPQQIGADNQWKQVACVPERGCTFGLKDDGSLWVWGWSPFVTVTNQALLYTPSTHPFPGIPYPQNKDILVQPYRVGSGTWSHIDHNLGITTAGNLYIWGSFNQNGQQLFPPPWLPKRVPGSVLCKPPQLLY
jgi:alpha-tubulin suppressor-like RCC1 family protein